MARTRYSISPDHDQPNRVLIIRPRGVGPTTVFVPPIGASPAWSEEFELYEDALDIAIAANGMLPRAGDRGGPAILETHDTVDWWRTGLIEAD